MKNNYYRKITASLPQDLSVSPFILKYIVIFLSILALVLAMYLGQLVISYQAHREEQKQNLDTLSYWQDVVKTHPNFTDAYYNAAVYSLKVGQRTQAVNYLDHALVLDPSFTAAKNLEKQITK